VAPLYTILDHVTKEKARVFLVSFAQHNNIYFSIKDAQCHMSSTRAICYGPSMLSKKDKKKQNDHGIMQKTFFQTKPIIAHGKFDA
jgi:hypothetical protein